MKIKKIVLTLMLMLPFSTSVNATDKYVFDMSHSRIFFEVNHLGFSDYNGMFRDFEGTISFDEKKIENSKIDVTIDVASVDGFDEGLNEHLRNEDFFDVQKHPKARFVSKKVEKSGKNQARVIGELTLKGVTKPLALNVTFNKVGPHPFNKKQTAGFSASAVIDRTEFGINYGVPAVGKSVKLEIDVEASRQEQEAN